MLGEQVVTVREYQANWVVRPQVDRDELAKLRLVEGWDVKRLQAHFGCGRTKIQAELRQLRTKR